MVSGNKSKAARNSRPVVVRQKATPWGTIAAVAVVVLFLAAVIGYYVVQSNAEQNKIAALAGFTPTPENQDPSRQIEGVVVETYQPGQHVPATAQIAYTKAPPFGGAHDDAWATCTGVVYPRPVRTENLVHSLEHGAVWIAYNPDQVTGDALKTLQDKVDGQQFMAMSPYPDLDQPISLQSWGHQLKLSDAGDPRIDQFVQALRRNTYTFPEPRAGCNEPGPGAFVQDDPPPFQPAPPVSAIDGVTVRAEIGAPPPS